MDSLDPCFGRYQDDDDADLGPAFASARLALLTVFFATAPENDAVSDAVDELLVARAARILGRRP